MKKLSVFFAFLLLVCALALGLSSCGREVEFNVNFVVDGGVYYTIGTSGEEVVKIPENPTKDGYTFEGWYWDKDTWQTPFTANSLLDAPLSSDMSVYAKWEHIHIPSDWIEDKAATCKDEGAKHKECTVCGVRLEEGSINKTDSHTVVTDARIEPTDTEDGLTEGSHCSLCGKILVNQQKIPASLQGTDIISSRLNVSEGVIKGNVSNTTETFSFLNDIIVAKNAEYVVARDIYCEQVINSKTVPLEIGDNTFYILVTNGSDMSLYTVTVRRLPMYTVSFETNGGTVINSQMIEENSFASQPENPTRAGYTFVGWSYNFEAPIAESIRVNAIWTANQNTEYNVEYYLENLEDNGYTLHETVALSGTTDTIATAEIKTFEHFTFNSSKSVLSGNINGNGSLVLRVYYKRNIYTLSTNNSSAGELANLGSYKYGSSVSSSVTSVNLGYVFSGWYSDEVLLSTETTYTASADKNIVAKFDVKPELQAFNFTSSKTSCTVTGVKDKAITKIELPNYVTGIGASAFRACSELESVVISKGVTSIGNYAFYDCKKLKSIYLDSAFISGISQSNYIFCNSGADGSGITLTVSKDAVIPEALFEPVNSYPKITKIVIEDGATAVNGFKTKNYLPYLTEIVYPETITDASYGAFNNSLWWQNQPIGKVYISGVFYGYKCICRMATPNDPVTENLVDSTCTEPGSYDSVIYCGVCNTEISREEKTVNAKGHRIWQVAEPGTLVQNYIASNSSSYPFTVSEGIITSTNKRDYSSSTFTVTASRAFNLELQYKVASESSYDFLTIKHNSTQKDKISGLTSWASLTISMQPGDIVTFTYSKDSSQSQNSDCAYIKLLTASSVIENKQLIPATEELLSTLNSTCTEDVCCDVCNAVLIARLGHDYIHHEAQESTCTEVGWSAYDSCSRCDYTTYVEILALDHDYIHHEAQESTCTEVGWSAYDSCSRCDYTTYVEIPALDHDYIHHEAQEVSCTEIGWSAYDNCSRCDYTTYVEIPALDHDYIHHEAQEVSCTEIGWSAYDTCSRCDYTTYVEIPATSIHNVSEGYCSMCGGKESSAGLEFSLNADGKSYTVTGIGTCTETEIVIGIYNNLIVTSIGSYAFEDCDSLTSVTIGNSVTSIGYDAFSYCYSLEAVYITDIAKWCGVSFGNYSANPLYYANNLYLNGELVTSLVIPDSVTSIGYGAFYYCSSLTSVVIPDSVTSIGSYAFCYCSSLTSVVIPDSVTSIGSYAFYDCSSLTSVIIPDSVTSIGSYAFCHCSSLTSVVIPDSVTSIDSSAFEYCSSLTSIVIPDSVTSIGSYAFSGCSSLASITVSENNPNYKSIDGNLYTKDGKRLIQYAIGKQATSFEIPSGVESISSSAFENCSSLTSVVIPDSLTSIGSSAFYDCSSLTSVVIPDSVTSIGSSAFRYCSSLTSVVIPDSVTSISSSAFENCSSLTSVVIPDSVTSIGYGAFYYCSSLTSVVITDSVTSIGSSAFENCSSLTSIVIPDSVTSIGSFAFSDCSSLIIYCEVESKPAGWHSYWKYSGRPVVWDCNNNDIADDGCIYTVIDGIRYAIKDSVATVLKQSQNITVANIPESITYKSKQYKVTSIDSEAFYSCDDLETVVIPDSVTSIGSFAFSYCTSLKSVVIPDSVTIIGEYAFNSCSSIYCEAKSKPAGWDSYWKSYYCQVVWDCNSDGYIHMVIDGIHYGIKDGVATVLKQSQNITVANIAESITYKSKQYKVTSIAPEAFYSCDDLETVVIPDSVTSISSSAFENCSSLTSVVIPDSVTSIGSYAFYDCDSLTSVTIGNGVTSIGSYAFRYCSSLTSVEFKNPSNWKAGSKSISEDALKDTSTAATYLTLTYSHYNWERKLYYTVSFDTVGGATDIPIQNVAEGGKVTEPSIPKKDKHRFDGWYLDGKLWDFHEDKVTNSITLTAKWVEVVTVTFDLGDGTTIPVTVDKNQPVAKISDPSKNGFLFCAWRDSNGTEWNFNTIVTEDITLTAFWLEACVVSFDTDGAGEMASVIVDKGELLEVPTPPNRGEQWRIRGWYYGDVEWNFATDKVTTNITLKAKWVIQTPVDSFE